MQLDPIGQAIVAGKLVPLARQFRLGVEVQMHRVQAGKLSRADYPQAFGDQRQNPNIKNDFTQTQTELVTPPLVGVGATMDYLTGVNTAARRGLAENESFWPLSMPPALSSSHQEVAVAEVAPENFMQRQAIVAKRSITNLLVCRPHVNLSFAEPLFQQLYAETFHRQYGSYVEFRNAVYLKVAQGFLRSRYLLTLLFGASPVAEANFFQQTDTAKQPVRSFASSQLTATNRVAGDFTSVEAYVSKLTADVKQHELISTDEFAGPVQFSGSGKLTDLPRQGIYYLELRCLDLDPTSANGVSETALSLIQLLALYFAVTPGLPTAIVKQTLTNGQHLNEQVALEDPREISSQAEAARTLLGELLVMIEQFDLPAVDRALVQECQSRLQKPTASLSARLWKHVEDESLSAWAQQQAQDFQQQALAEPFRLAGFTNLNLSSQAVVQQALQAGLQVKTLAVQPTVLQLQKGTQSELLVNGTGTNLNPQAMAQILNDQATAKQLLADQGAHVPASRTFKNAAQLIQAYDQLAQNGLTLKGLSRPHQVIVFRLAPDRDLFKASVEKLFSQNQAVMAEETVVGASYRFLVIGGKVQAIVERIPANIVGDGRSTVKQLLASKNARTFRGPAFKFPQSQLKLGQLEQASLTAYHLTLDSVITRGSQVMLRDDATFGNGADVLDVTDEMDASYRQFVEKLAADLHLSVAGFDLILDNLYAPLDADHPEMATVLGVHPAPVLYPHLYPMFGKAQPVAKALLATLFKK